MSTSVDTGPISKPFPHTHSGKVGSYQLCEDKVKILGTVEAGTSEISAWKEKVERLLLL